MTLNRWQRHLLLPALAPLAFWTVAATPVTLLGCRNRGLLAGSIALLAALLAVVTALRAVYGRQRGETTSHWWVFTTLMLAIPALCVVWLARCG